jgi:enoyl-CoA hydratase/carnithine racemase
MFATSQGSPHARFRRALATGNLTLIRAAASELPGVDLEDALRICFVYRKAPPDEYERAAVRWLGRLCLERPQTTMKQLREALEALERLGSDPDRALGELRRLSRRA